MVSRKVHEDPENEGASPTLHTGKLEPLPAKNDEHNILSESLAANPKAEVSDSHPDSPTVGGAKDSQDWIAEASHELRLPIANLKLLVDTLLDGALYDEATAKLMLMRARQEVDRLHRLVVNLLSVEQTGASREVQRNWMRLRLPAKYATDSTLQLAKSKNITVETRIEPDFSIYANAEQLEQVLLNLVENAIKFTPEGGKVTIRSGPQAGSFSVEDTGVGIAPLEIPKIFQRFYRVDRTQSRGSTGLGLSIVKHIADLHGAKITVTSKEGVGSVFLLEFPDP